MIIFSIKSILRQYFQEMLRLFIVNISILKPLFLYTGISLQIFPMQSQYWYFIGNNFEECNTCEIVGTTIHITYIGLLLW